MKVLVIGGGGREHALCTALARSDSVAHVYCAPGNGGIADVAGCVPHLQASDHEGLADFAEREGIDLTVVGPEAPLVAGLADRFRERGLAVFGPGAEGARLEGSKSFAKELFARHNIPSAAHQVFNDPASAREYVEQLEYFPVVLKADGLAAGKGVLICEDRETALAGLEEIMISKRFGAAGERLVIEEFLRGEEASIHAITDGKTLVVLPTAQDHKRVGDGDTGPNTGGMGAYSPAPVAEGAALDKIIRTILVPTLHALRLEGIDFRGVLFCGLMMTKGGPRVLEYNVRFGDPETQVILPRIRNDMGLLLKAAADGKLDQFEAGLDLDPRAAVGVVMASAGYPGSYPVGRPVEGLDHAAGMQGVRVYHAGTSRKEERIVTAGGRVLCVTALADGHRAARDRAYEAVDAIRFEGGFHRSDIAHRVLGRN